MQETAIDIARIVLVTLHAAWLGLAVFDNMRHADVNRSDVAKVLDLEALKEEPEIRARVAQRAISNPRTVRLLFAAIVAAETVVALALSLAAICLVLALLGVAENAFAHAFAIYAVTGFCAIWTGFLIGGQWFFYWYGDFGQRTHLLLAIWGVATLMVVLQ